MGQGCTDPLGRRLKVTFLSRTGRAVVLAHWSTREIQAVANELNSRPRKIAWLATPAKAVDENLQSAQSSVLATTGLSCPVGER